MEAEIRAKKHMSYADMSSFFENMGMMIRAGITASEAAELLSEDTSPENRGLKRIFAVMSEKMATGLTLGDSMKESGLFDGYAIDMVSASEDTGKLEDALFHLADYYRMENSMKNTFTAAVRYPVVLLLMVIAILGVMIWAVFPVFYGVYERLTGSLASSSFQYINISFAVCKGLMILMVVLVLVILFGVVLYKTGFDTMVKNALSQIKAMRNLLYNLDLYRFTSCFDMFISCGSMQEEALKKSLPTIERKKLKNKLLRCIDYMEEGQSFSQSACREQLYDSINNRMLIPAERSGMLDAVLKKIMVNLKDNNDENIARIANTIEPLLTGLLMIVIGLTLISLMVPLIGIMNSIG